MYMVHFIKPLRRQPWQLVQQRNEPSKWQKAKKCRVPKKINPKRIITLPQFATLDAQRSNDIVLTIERPATEAKAC